MSRKHRRILTKEIINSLDYIIEENIPEELSKGILINHRNKELVLDANIIYLRIRYEYGYAYVPSLYKNYNIKLKI